MSDNHFSDEALSIGALARGVETSILRRAANADDLSVVVLAVATVVAALPEAEQIDFSGVEAVLRQGLGDHIGGSLRFAEFIRSLSIWVNATVLRTGAAVA